MDYAQRSRISQVDLFDLWGIAWSAKWPIGGVTLVFALVSVLYALSLPNIFRAETVLVPAETEGVGSGLSSLAGQLAGLSGLTIRGTTDVTDEALAILRSRAFTERFIDEHGLMPELFSDIWDPARQAWTVDDLEDRPTPWQAFKKLDDVRTINYDKASRLVTFSIEWRDPALATEWVNRMVADLNSFMQRRAIADAERNRRFLEEQITATDVVELRQVLYRLLENEVKSIMLARGRPEYAFKVVDPALVPEQKAKPSRAVICIALTMLGALVATFAAFVRHGYRMRKRSAG